jgi:hypothetical protein
VIDSSPSNGPWIAAPPGLDQRAELRRRLRHLDLEVAHQRHLAREAHEERDRQRDARQRRVLHHDRQARDLRDMREVLEHARSSARSPVPWYGGISISICAPAGGRRARPLAGDARAEVAARDDHRHAAGDVRAAELEQRRALVVGEQELLGVVREDADAVDALVDHAVEHAPHARQVEAASVVERRRRDRVDAGPGLRRRCGHGGAPSALEQVRAAVVEEMRPLVGATGRADAFGRQHLEQERARHAAVDDVHRPHAGADGLDRRARARDQVGGDRARGEQALELLRRSGCRQGGRSRR